MVEMGVIHFYFDFGPQLPSTKHPIRPRNAKTFLQDNLSQLTFHRRSLTLGANVIFQIQLKFI